MQDINELIQLLEQHRIRLSRPSSKNPENDASVLRLFEGIRTGQYSTDADAASDMFPGASADHAGYFETRTALRGRLAQVIAQFASELEQCPDVQQAHFECQKLWLNVRTLSGQNAALLALDLAAHLLRIAEKFDFTLLGMDMAQYLRLQHCTRDIQGEQCAEADAKLQYFRQVLEAEFQAEKLYTDLTALSVDNRTPKEEMHRLAKVYTDTLAHQLRKYPSAKLHLYGNLIALQQYTAARDYSGALHYCENAIRFFKEKPYCARDPLQIFYYQQLLCSIHLRHLDAGERAARACLELTGENTFNQFKIKELLLLLQLYGKQYDRALTVFADVSSDPQFAFLPGAFKTGWAVYEPYLAFLVSCGAISESSQKESVSIERANNADVSVNSAWLAIRFIRLLEQKQYAEAQHYAIELGQYRETHLTGLGERRSALFFNMLAQIPAGNFQRTEIIPLASRFFAQLQATPLALGNQTWEFEIVPYEDLWEMALKLLEESR